MIPTVSSRLLRACRRRPADATPVWFMRQAGRYLPEYQSLRRKHTLAELCVSAELAAQVTLQPLRHLDAGAQVVQVFDSRVGVLSAAEYGEFVRPHSAAVFAALEGRGVPAIHYGQAGPDVLADPTLLLGRLERPLAGAAEVLDRTEGRPGHVFNLGHGLLPTTPLEHAQALARYVHTHTRS